MNVNTGNSAYTASNIPQLRKVELTEEMKKKIQDQIDKGKSLGASLEISSEGQKLSSGCVTGKRDLETTPLPSRAITDLCRTGYEEIDNPIVDALNTVDSNVREYAHNIIRQDFLRVGMAGITEEERQDMISMGLAEAQYVADNYMDEQTGKSFMEAIGKVAKIATAGKADETGALEYALPSNRGMVDEQGHTVETTDVVGMMKRYSPDTYKEYRALQDEFAATGNKDKMIDSLRVVIRFVTDTAKKNPGLVQRYESEKPYQMEDVQSVKVSDRFQKADTSTMTNFSDSIRRLFSGSAVRTSLFENRLDTMRMMLQFNKIKK